MGISAASGAAGLTAWTGRAASLGARLVVFAVLAMPCLGLFWGRSWSRLELFRTAPDPTSLATLGLVPLIRHRLRPMLLIVPTVWSFASGLTLLAIGDPLWPVLPALASSTLVLVFLQRRLGPSGAL